MPDDDSKIEIRFETSSGFRTVHVDGAWGGVTPSGGVAVSFYNEQAAYPEKLILDVDARGQKVGETRIATGDVVRVVEFDARMSPRVARSVAAWLNEKADEAEQMVRNALQANEPGPAPTGTE